MHKIAAASLILLASCDMVPGTDAHLQRRAKDAAKEMLIDPDSAQFRKVAAAKDGSGICGEINGRNRMGAYSGFTRFIFSPSASKVEMAQPIVQAPGDLDYASRRCEQLRSNPTMSPLADVHCDRADRLYAELKTALAFDEKWQKVCPVE